MKTAAFVLMLLTVATSASADCSWVLWSYALDKGADSYSIELARPTRQECVAEVRGYGDTMKSSGYTVTGGHPNSSEVFGTKGSSRFKYFCLPDTADPRESRAK